jgi:hypothetical protein
VRGARRSWRVCCISRRDFSSRTLIAPFLRSHQPAYNKTHLANTHQRQRKRESYSNSHPINKFIFNTRKNKQLLGARVSGLFCAEMLRDEKTATRAPAHQNWLRLDYFRWFRAHFCEWLLCFLLSSQELCSRLGQDKTEACFFLLFCLSKLYSKHLI